MHRRQEGIVATFFAAFFFYTGIMLVFSVPVFVVAWRKERTKTALQFFIAAGVIGLFCAVISVSSERLVAQCEAAPNTGCLDPGSAGFQLLAVVGYIVTSWVIAVTLSDAMTDKRTNRMDEPVEPLGSGGLNSFRTLDDETS